MKEALKEEDRKFIADQYPVIVHDDVPGGYWVECPAFQGCFSQGETIDEALKNIKEAIELCKEEAHENERERPGGISLHVVRL